MKKTLADYRREAGYNTQYSLSIEMDVERNTVSRWESGERFPRPQVIPKLALLLNVTEGEIIAAITAAKSKDTA